MDAEIRQHVFADSIRESRLESASARGYRAMTYPGQTYPVLAEAVGERVEGLVLHNLNAEALARMAFYEGPMYELGTLQIVTAAGESLLAHYNRAVEHDLVLDQPWSYEEWQSSGRLDLLESTRLHMTSY